MLSPQAGIAALTLTVMQGFEPKKDNYIHLHPGSITYAQSIRESNPDAEGRELSVLTTRPPNLQICSDKMSYLNQMYEKKAIQGYASMRLPT